MSGITGCVEGAIDAIDATTNIADAGRNLRGVAVEVEQARSAVWRAKVNYVRRAREAGLTVVEIASILKVSEGYIRRCQRGKRGPGGGD